MVNRKLTIQEKFEQSYIPEPNLGCWIWLGSLTANGYGVMFLNGRRLRAHRLAIMLSGIDIPHGEEVCHKCDNPPCVNPGHLFVATHQENMLDASRKHRLGIYTHPETHIFNGPNRPQPRGELHGHSVLTEPLVREIRANTDKSSYQLAREYRVSASAIQYVLARKTWKHVL